MEVILEQVPFVFGIQLFSTTQYRTGNLDGGIGMSRTRRLAAYLNLTATYKFVTLHGTFRNDWNSL